MTVAAWDALHRDPRHRLEWPSEHVVRFLAGLSSWRSAIDIGAGSGRHSSLLRQSPLARVVASVDVAGSHGVTRRADMRALPYGDGMFDVAIAYGVFYYGSADDHRQAVAEMRRVLRPGGKALVKVRTPNDWRAAHTRSGVFRCEGEPEDGMEMHFLARHAIPSFYGGFTLVEVEKTETTTKGMSRCDSDWLLTCTK